MIANAARGKGKIPFGRFGYLITARPFSTPRENMVLTYGTPLTLTAFNYSFY